MKKELFVLMLFALGWGQNISFASGAISVVHEQPTTHKVVFHLTTDVLEEHKALFNNLKNILAGWEGKVEIEVVAHGPGVSLFMKENPLAQEALYWHEHYPVHFSICENTLKQKDISKQELLNGFSYVPMGVAYVIELQEKGYAYIKANF